MVNQFVFPPAPPPPPPASAQSHPGSSYPSQQGSWSSRGRGGFGHNTARGGGGRGGYGRDRVDKSGQISGYSYQQRNAFRSQNGQVNRGHGHNYGQQHGQSHGSFQYPGARDMSGNGFANNTSQTTFRDTFSKATDDRRVKRPYDQAFPRKAIPVKTQAAPAVPSFGIALPSPPVQSKSASGKPDSSLPKKRNLLGLIPSEDEDASDEDEEAKLANIDPSGHQENVLSYSYKGKLATLKSMEEIAAWVAERRRNFSSDTKRELTAKKKAEEREKAAQMKQAVLKKLQDSKQSKQSKQPKARPLPQPKSKSKKKADHITEDKKHTIASSSGTSLSKEQLKIEKLRKEMERNAKKLAKLEAAAQRPKAQSMTTTMDTTSPERLSRKEVDLHNTVISEDESSTISSLSDSEDTSSSGSSSSSDEDEDEDDLASSLGSESDRQDIFDSEDSQNDQEDSDSDSEAPQELSSSRKSPIRVLAPKRTKSDIRPLCRYFQNHGKCNRKFCKFRHKLNDKDGDSKRRHEAKKPPEKLSLYQRLLKQQIEEDQRAENGIAQGKGAQESHVDKAPS